MTHMPPIPDAASAPYPPHPAPIPEAQKLATAAAEAAAARKAESDAASELLVKRMGIGLGAALLVGVAAWGLRLYSRPASTPVRSRPRRAAGETTRGRNQDRARVAGGEQYEVRYFARKHRISAAEARAIIQQAGPSRKDANRLAEARKRVGAAA